MPKKLFTLIFISFLFPKSAHAYLDPGSGSYLIQMIIAGIASFGFIFSGFWKRIRDIFKKKKHKHVSD